MPVQAPLVLFVLGSDYSVEVLYPIFFAWWGRLLAHLVKRVVECCYLDGNFHIGCALVMENVVDAGIELINFHR